MMSARKTSILMLLENSTYPGDTRVRSEATTLVNNGYRVSVICPGLAHQPKREVLGGVTVYRYKRPPDGSGLAGYFCEYGIAMVASLWLSLVCLVREGFDIVHAHNPPDFFVLIACLYKMLGKQFVFDHHDLSPEMYRAKFSGTSKLVFQLLVFFERLSCRLADHVIATNESYKRVEMERCQIPESRITIVRNGPDLTRVRLHSIDPVARGTVGTVIAYAGVMGYQDGVEYLLDAVHSLVDDLKRQDLRVLLIGDGDAKKMLQNRARELAIEEYIHFTGWIDPDDVMRYLSSADICVDSAPSSPYNDLSTTIKLMEYMALGKPIVAFDLPESRVSAGEAALFATPNDVHEFARKLAELMDDSSLRRRLGQTGLARVHGALSWSCQEQQLIQAYQDLVSGRNTADRQPVCVSEPVASTPRQTA